MLQPGRKYSAGNGYRYGFNGKENDKEVEGDGNSLDFGARVYDSRLGNWLSIDPLFKKYEKYSPYTFCIDNPIAIIDYDGRDIIDFIKNVRKSREYAIASTIWTKVSTFNNTLSRFANINKNDDSKNLGFEKSGDLSGVKIEFRPTETGPRGEGIQGLTTIMALDNKGNEIDLIGYQGDMTKIDLKSLKVVVQFTNSTRFGQKVAVGNHELLVHAEADGELLDKLQKGQISLTDFSKELNVINANYQHTKMTNGYNEKYNTANEELKAVIKNDPKLAKGFEYVGPNDFSKILGTAGTEGITPPMNKDGFYSILQTIVEEIAGEKSWYYRTAAQKPSPILQVFDTKEKMEAYFNTIRKK